MAVDDPDVIDIVTTVRATGEVVLVITDHLRWSVDDHLEILQTKINKYLAYIESGQLAEAYLNAKPGVPVRIEVSCKYRPSRDGVRFLELAREAIQAAGWGFSWELPQRKRAERGAAPDRGGTKHNQGSRSPRRRGRRACCSAEGALKVDAKPFMEHPSDEDFLSPVDAMADAIARLRTLPVWDKWITFQAQGMGPRVDSYHFADIRMLGRDVRLAKRVAVDLDFVAKRARVPRAYLTHKGGRTYSLGRATAKQAARVLHVIFVHHLGIRPHPDDEDDTDLVEDDYAVGAEW